MLLVEEMGYFLTVQSFVALMLADKSNLLLFSKDRESIFMLQ